MKNLDNLSRDEREEWEERAAIAEFCGGLDRKAAEEVAWECHLNAREGAATQFLPKKGTEIG